MLTKISNLGKLRTVDGETRGAVSTTVFSNSSTSSVGEQKWFSNVMPSFSYNYGEKKRRYSLGISFKFSWLKIAWVRDETSNDLLVSSWELLRRDEEFFLSKACLCFAQFWNFQSLTYLNTYISTYSVCFSVMLNRKAAVIYDYRLSIEF